MSECALRSRKFDSVYYSDINASLVELIRKAINGEFNYERFKPEFITREKFIERKDEDAYVRWIWSFGNNGDAYLFGADIEEIKKDVHNCVVFDKPSEYYPDFKPTGNDIKSRRMQWRDYCKKNGRFDLQRLEQLERLQRLEFHCGSYLDYEYQDGDVVYCDPPYEASGDGACYACDFNSAEFYDWVASRDYQVYFSNYDISDDRFALVRRYEIKSSMGGGNSAERVEKLYTNKPHQEIQLTLF